MQETKAYQLLLARKSTYLPQLSSACDHAETLLTQNVKVFDTYTMHNMQHSVNVAEYMFELVDNPDALNDLELIVLLYAALFHDIGMGVTQDEIDQIKTDNLPLGGRKYSRVLKKFKNEHIALQECIRPVHALRSADRIRNLDQHLFLVPGTSTIAFQEETAKICQAHNEDFLWIKMNLKSDVRKGRDCLNPQFIAALLRIGDYLDMDEQRAPLYLYQHLQPKEYSDLEWRQHFCIENFDKIVKNKKTGLKEISFFGQSNDPSVHRKLLKYFDGINKELSDAISLSETFEDEKYQLHLRTSVVNRICTEGFSISDVKLVLDYKAVTNLLMGEHIYGNPKYGLREIIQNSIDACKTMMESAESMEEYRIRTYEPYVSIYLDQARGTVSIQDNGSGMTLDILKNYFLNVGVSYYRSDDYLLQGHRYQPIGHYGIGFLACFMLSDSVRVITKHISSSKPIRVDMARNSEYISLAEDEIQRQQGTEIVLEYAPFMDIFHSIDGIKSFIEENFVDSDVPIIIIAAEDGVSNSQKCCLKAPTAMISEAICLNDYLNGMEVYVGFSYKGINFSRTLSDLSGFVCSYYDHDTESSIVEDEDLRDIRQYISNGMIQIISCYVIEPSEADDFRKALDVLEDYEDALEKIEHYMVAGFMTDHIDDLPLVGDNLISELDETVFENYSFETFCKEYGHDKQIPTMVNLKSFDVISNHTSEVVLPYHKDGYFGGKYAFHHTDKTYLKGVLLPKAVIKLPYVADGIVLKNAVINITGGDFFPNVSRENLSIEMQEKIGYAIGKALHLWIVDHAELSAEQRILLTDFIKYCYSKCSDCLSKDTSWPSSP